MISTRSPGKMAKCGWFSNSFAAASCEPARTTVKAPISLAMSAIPFESTFLVLPSGPPMAAIADWCFSTQAFHAAIPCCSLARRSASGSAFQAAIFALVLLPRKTARNVSLVLMRFLLPLRLTTSSRPRSAGRWFACVDRQLSVEGALVGGPRFAAGHIGGEVRTFVQQTRRPQPEQHRHHHQVTRAERAIEPGGIAKATGKLVQPATDAILDQRHALRGPGLVPL